MKRKTLTVRAWVIGTTLGALLALSGCSTKAGLNQVRGKVLYEGQPAVGAKVIFHPKDHSDPQALRPCGFVAEDGSFTLSSHEPGDGAPAGDYVVIVVWPDKSGEGRGPDIKQPSRDRLRGAYSNPEKPLLQTCVANGDNDLPAFELH